MKKAFGGLGIVDAGNPDRHPDDYYGGPDEAVATRALMKFLKNEAGLGEPERWWDPACGGGNIAGELRCPNRTVAATDLHDRGWYGAATGIDFLRCLDPFDGMIVSNPPFRLANSFIEHAHRLNPFGVAFLLKSSYFQAARRLMLFRTYKPRYVLPFTWRLDFTGQGAPLMECAWFVWLSRAPGAGRVCEYVPLAKPEDAE